VGAQGGSQIGPGREDFACGNALLPTPSKGLEIELPAFKAEDAMPKDDYWW